MSSYKVINRAARPSEKNAVPHSLAAVMGVSPTTGTFHGVTYTWVAFVEKFIAPLAKRPNDDMLRRRALRNEFRLTEIPGSDDPVWALYVRLTDD